MPDIFTAEQVAALKAKLDPANVRRREQSGRSLSYIEGWHAIDEANRIFGFDGWARETVEMRLVSEQARKVGKQGADGWSVSYIAKVRVYVGPIMREGYGSGHGIDRDLGLAHESAAKEAETDAMKRALMTFGNPFGLALYDKDQANVGVDIPAPDMSHLPPEMRREDLTAMEVECVSKIVEAMMNATNRHDFAKWWSAFKDGARRILPEDYYAEIVVPLVKNRASSLPDPDHEKDAA